MVKSLGIPERATLLFLAVRGGQIVASQLKPSFGVQLKKSQRTRLVERGLISVEKEGRSFLLSLSEEGWRFLDELGAEPPPTRWSGDKALFALLAALAERGHKLRGLLGNDDDASGKEEADPKLAPIVDRPDSLATDSKPPTLGARVASAYRELAREPRDWVSLTRLRAVLSDVGRGELDETLHAMRTSRMIILTLEEDRSRLTREDRAAALTVGSDSMHYLSMD